MATSVQVQHDQALQNLFVLIDQVNGFTDEQLARIEELGKPNSFEPALLTFRQIRELLSKLKACDYMNVPLRRIQDASGAIQGIFQVYSQMQGFNAVSAGPSAPQARQSLLSQLETAFNVVVEKIGPIFAIGSEQLKNIESATATARARASEATGLVERQRKTLQDAEDLLSKSRETAQKVGVVEHAQHFAEEANSHLKASRIWLCATSFSAGLLLFGCWWNLTRSQQMLEAFSKSGQDLPLRVGLQFALSKVFIFSLLLTAVLWTGKNYRAQRHNFIVNKHRQNALSSFQTFVKSAEDDAQTKNAILLQATQCIFMPQPTGYITHDGETEGAPKILEVFRAVSDK